MTRHQAAIRLAHILGIGVIRAEQLVTLAESESAGQHAWQDEMSTEAMRERAYQREQGR